MLPPFQSALVAAGYDLERLDLQWSMLERFYLRIQGRLVWHADGELNAAANLLIEWISSIDSEGLSPQDYHSEILGYFPAYTLGMTRQLRELVLTDAFFRLATDMQLGHFDPREIDPKWRLPVETFDPAAFLAAALDEGKLMHMQELLRPSAGDYARLREAYVKYLQIARTGGWPRLDVKYTLRPGMDDPAVRLLRKRLSIEGDLAGPEEGNSWLYDARVTQAVRHFQRRHGLRDDGVVGPVTRVVMNVSVARRIKQLLVNLERWRWMPREMGDQYLLVNAAGYELTLVADGEPVLRKRAITGRKKRQTPSFESRITHLVVNPEWTVPRRIAVEDLLPKQRADVEFLDKSGIRVLQQHAGDWVRLDPKTIDWTRYDKEHFPFLLRQESGPKNSLGRIKFHMNNPYAIYLHDTPSVGLFNKPIRAFSSGCVRVQEAEQLARYLLNSGGQSSQQLVDLPLQSGATLVTRLNNPIEVYLTYFTSWVDGDGAVQFRPDTYQRNTALMLALSGSDGKLADNRNHSAADSL